MLRVLEVLRVKAGLEGKKPRPPKWRGEAGGSERGLAVVEPGVEI